MRKVIKSTGEPTVHIDDVSTCKIYVSEMSGYYYKLSFVNSKWIFCALDGSVAAGRSCDTIKEAVREEINVNVAKVYELDNIQELIEFLKKGESNERE